MTEAELHPVRDRYADLIKDTRKRTGQKLHAAHTVTVHRRNLDQIEDVMAWMVKNLDAFRMVSFQPVAKVGRTQDDAMADLELDDVWDRICKALGVSLNRHAMHFGHPECHIVAPLVIVRTLQCQLVLETARAGHSWDGAFLRRLLGRVGGYSVRGRSRIENVAGIVGLALRSPLLLLEAVPYGIYRAWRVRREVMALLVDALSSLSLSIRPLAIVVHRFMGSEELDTPLGRERLRACTLKVPVGGEMLSMCELNATGLRSRLYPRTRERKAGLGWVGFT